MSRLVSLYDSCTGGEFRGMVKTNFSDNYALIERFKNISDEDGVLEFQTDGSCIKVRAVFNDGKWKLYSLTMSRTELVLFAEVELPKDSTLEQIWRAAEGLENEY